MASEREGKESRDRDLVLDPTQYAYILDETKGHISVYVGPTKTSLANTDRPVKYSKQKGFEECGLEEATKRYPTADEGFYLVLENPAESDKELYPRAGSSALTSTKLLAGRKINIPGPVSFPLWPGQSATVIQGHNLRSNQYLIVRVYNEEMAKANWNKAVVRAQATQTEQNQAGEQSQSDGQPPAPAPPPAPPAPAQAAPVANITMGQLLVIKGTEVSFYIPPTGIEVLPDETGQYVRSAVTLERLEYCILLDENGTKRFVRGPAVVFPQPTETFVKSKDLRKFKAIDLNELSGLYIKVIAPYNEGGKEYKEGDELFITGKDQMIYFPRQEHAIIKYGQQEIHYAVAIPAGEARYVLDRESGKISLKRGPSMFLPDPRKQVIVKRVLDEKTVQLLFPGNAKALEYNRNLAAQGYSGFSGVSGSPGVSGAGGFSAGLAANSQGLQSRNMAEIAQIDDRAYSNAWENEAASREVGADDFQRRQRFTQPKTVSLDTKYDGAVAVNIWTGYAILVVDKSGGRKVVQGPQTVLLEYDESLEGMELSTGTPKTDASPLKTVYLRVKNNKVSDVITAVTKDLVQVSIKASYRVNFEGEPNNWFGVENYVKFLTEHLRSFVRNIVKQHGIEKFNNDAIQIVRDAILGAQDQQGKRPGRKFDENGMKVYDVEVLDIVVGDQTIAQMLTGSQHNAVRQAITIAQKETELATTKRAEFIQQEIEQAKANTLAKSVAIRTEAEQRESQYRLAVQEAKHALQELIFEAQEQEQAAKDKASEHERARDSALFRQRHEAAQAEAKLKAEAIGVEADAIVKKAGAISPQLISALQAFGDKEFLGKLTTAFGAHALLRGNSVADVLAQLVHGSPELGNKLVSEFRVPPVLTAAATAQVAAASSGQ